LELPSKFYRSGDAWSKDGRRMDTSKNLLRGPIGFVAQCSNHRLLLDMSAVLRSELLALDPLTTVFRGVWLTAEEVAPLPEKPSPDHAVFLCAQWAADALDNLYLSSEVEGWVDSD